MAGLWGVGRSGFRFPLVGNNPVPPSRVHALFPTLALLPVLVLLLS